MFRRSNSLEGAEVIDLICNISLLLLEGVVVVVVVVVVCLHYYYYYYHHCHYCCCHTPGLHNKIPA